MTDLQRADLAAEAADYIAGQISGRTVADFINQALAEEAALRLRKSSQSISQLAKDLHFSDQAAFTKFFIRMKGMTPKAFRNSTKDPSSLT